MAATMNAATFMGKNFSTIQNFIMNSEDLTLKQMFDVTAQLVNNQEEIHGVDKIQWEKDSWKRLSLIGDETVIHLQRTKVYVFSDSVLCLGRILRHPDSNEAWKNRIAGVMAEKSFRDYDGIDGEPTEFEWNIFPGFTTLQLCGKVSDLLSDLGQKPETFTGRILFMSMFNDISCDRNDNKEECLANAGVVKVLARRFGVGQWSFIGPGSEKKWYSSENTPQGAWDNIAEQMLLEFAESGHPTFRATTPLSRGTLKSKGRGKLSIHFAADQDTRTCVCANTFMLSGWHTQGEKDELTSCRGTVQSAWQKPPVRRKGGRAGLPARVSGRHVVRGRQSSPTLEVRLAEQARLVKTVKIQVRWAARSPWRRP